MDLDMGTMAEAEATLEARGRTWRELRQPTIATRAEHKETEAKEREARIRLAEAAVLWLWHRENPAPCPPHKEELRTDGERATKVCVKCGNTRELPATNNA